MNAQELIALAVGVLIGAIGMWLKHKWDMRHAMKIVNDITKALREAKGMGKF